MADRAAALASSTGELARRLSIAILQNRTTELTQNFPPVPQQTLILNHQGDIESVDTASLPATITDLVRASKSGEDYWASMSITSGDSSSILSFSERLLRHEISRYLILCYFKNYHNRFPFAYEPWIWQAMESVQQSNGSTFRLQAGTQALLLSIIAMASCGAEPWKSEWAREVQLGDDRATDGADDMIRLLSLRSPPTTHSSGRSASQLVVLWSCSSPSMRGHCGPSHSPRQRRRKLGAIHTLHPESRSSPILHPARRVSNERWSRSRLEEHPIRLGHLSSTRLHECQAGLTSTR